MSHRDTQGQRSGREDSQCWRGLHEGSVLEGGPGSAWEQEGVSRRQVLRKGSESTGHRPCKELWRRSGRWSQLGGVQRKMR